ncbi:MAG TPA: hypothetical protein VNJ08_01090 [Bacteriovoracaceae bacterium]|nr:hypothetical protein [Bacteriovoracaceae bacterium]
MTFEKPNGSRVNFFIISSLVAEDAIFVITGLDIRHGAGFSSL